MWKWLYLVLAIAVIVLSLTAEAGGTREQIVEKGLEAFEAVSATR